jgi:hypothetical protein
VLLLQQYGDVLAIDEPTHTFASARHGREPPSLSGLYDKHTPDQITHRLRMLEAMRPGICGRHGILGMGVA